MTDSRKLQKRNIAAALDLIEPDKRSAMERHARNMARGRNDPVFFGEHHLGLKFHPKQKIWLWLTTKTQIAKAIQLASEKKIPILNTLIETEEDAQKLYTKLAAHPFLKNILAPGNRFGKTFVISVKHIWYNFYKIGETGPPEYIKNVRYHTLNISPHSLQVDAAYRYIVDIFQDKFVYDWRNDDGQIVKIKNRCRIKNFLADYKQTRREVHFANSAIIKGVPTGEDQASSLAGTDFAYISYDEAPQSLHLRTELPAKILSRLIDSGGPCDIIGTPEVDKPSHAYYERIVKEGMMLKNGFFSLTGCLDDNPFIPDEAKYSVLESIKQTDKNKWLQVAKGLFISSGSKMFDNVAIQRMWLPEVRQYQGVGGHKYIIGVDWGFSDTGDPCVFYVVDYTALDGLTSSEEKGKVYYHIVHHETIQGGDPYVALARLRLLQEMFNDAHVIHDSTSMGGVMLKKMMRELHIQHVYDFYTARSPKDEMLFLLMRAMNHGRVQEEGKNGEIIEKTEEFGKMRSYLIESLEEQLSGYTSNDKGLEQDHVMALGMTIWYLERKYAHHKTKVFDLNILADRPEQILRVRDKAMPTRPVEIVERSL